MGNYKVADTQEQTYVSLEEARADNVVTGTYSYVDPLGSLITVKYTAGPMGYTEERTEQPGFVEIVPKPASVSSGSPSSSSSFSGTSSSSLSSGSSSRPFTGISSSSSGSSSLSSSSSSSLSGSSNLSSGSSSSIDDSSLIETILSQIRPLISETVSTAVAGQTSSSFSSTLDQSSSLSSGQSSSSLSSGQDSLLILRPDSSSSSSSSSSSDLVAQIVAQISPLVSQTVSSVVDSNSQTGRSDLRGSSSVQDTQSVFGSGDTFNVKINHAGANV